MSSSIVKGRKVVGKEDWLEARRQLLEREKAWTRQRDALAAERQAMPWHQVDADYVFEGEQGPVSLAALFGRHHQLCVYHFMYGTDWEAGCKSCSFWADGFNSVLAHLAARDVRLVCVSKAPLAKLLQYRARMGWLFDWYSAANNQFNEDYGVSFAPHVAAQGGGDYNYREGRPIGQEMPGMSAFFKDDDGAVYHTYSCYARGLEPFNVAYGLLDLAPLGRNEQDLGFTMEWVQRHDEY
ncbi:MAG: thioredoxin family protein [Pseudomonadota bacterium]